MSTVTKESAQQARKRVENTKKRLGKHVQKVNQSQPAFLLKTKQTRKVAIERQKALEAQRKKKENNSNSNSNNNSPGAIIASIRASMKKTATRKLRR